MDALELALGKLIQTSKALGMMEIASDASDKLVKDLKKELKAEQDNLEQAKENIEYWRTNYRELSDKYQEVLFKNQDLHREIASLEMASPLGTLILKKLSKDIDLMDELFGKELYELLGSGKKIESIKALRNACRGLGVEPPGLKQAKDIVEFWIDNMNFYDCAECGARGINPLDHQCEQMIEKGLEPD